VPRLRLQLLLPAIFILAWAQYSALEPKQESGILPIDPPTPYIHYFPANSLLGRVLVIHGLDVSKEVTRLISAALADGGFEVYDIDLPGHGDSVAKFGTDLAQQAINNAKVFLGEKTIVLGHSLGAGLVLDLAATEQFSTIILLSPPPISIAELHADRVLIATGDIDIPRIRTFVPIAADIGNPKVESWLLPWGGHAAPIFNPAYVRRVVEWLGGDGNKTRTGARILWIAVMFIAALGFGVALLPGREVDRIDTPVATTLGRYVVGYGVALLVLKWVNPMAWLRFFATDYLIGFLFLSGLFLSVGAIYDRRECRSSRSWAGRAAQARQRAAATIDRLYGFYTAIAAAAFVIIVPGLVVSSRVLHMTVSDGRWWRFPCIAAAGLPLFISDELIIRPIHPRWKSDMVAILTRGILLALILTGVLTLNRESDFLVLIVPLIAIFWIGLWFAAGIVHRYTQSPIAAALFAATVQGWAFAAWFVTI